MADKGEMGACPSMTRSCMKEQKATNQASEVPKRMYYEPLGQNLNINYVTKILNNLHDLVF